MNQGMPKIQSITLAWVERLWHPRQKKLPSLAVDAVDNFQLLDAAWDRIATKVGVIACRCKCDQWQIASLFLKNASHIFLRGTSAHIQP